VVVQALSYCSDWCWCYWSHCCLCCRLEYSYRSYWSQLQLWIINHPFKSSCIILYKLNEMFWIFHSGSKLFLEYRYL